MDALRARVIRALMATMAISRGTPMILHGDELGRTQRGNNNAYCQDNELTWVDWSMPSGAEAQLRFIRQIFEFRRRHPAIRRYDFTEQTEMVWFSAAGSEMSKEAWRTPSRKYVALYLTTGVNEDSRHGGPYLMLFNASDSRANVILPNASYGRRWAVVVDTYVAHVIHLPTQPSGRLPENLSVVSARAKHRVGANSLQVLHCVDRWLVSPD